MFTIKIKLIFIIGLLTLFVHAQESPDFANPVAQGESTIVQEELDILLRDPFLSLKYQRGAYLVYDCYDGHWVCTSEPEFNNCLEIRKIQQGEVKPELACASVKKFVDEAQCNTVQARLTNRGYENRFCKSQDVRRMNRFF